MTEFQSGWLKHPPIKPGYGDPEPVVPVSTMDSPENVATCLDCPIADDCYVGTAECPLYSQKPGRRKRPTRAERSAQDTQIRDMVRNCWRDEAICQELHISRWTLNQTKRRLRERGELN